MGFMKVMVLLELVLFNFCFPASCAPIANNFNLGNSSEKVKEKQRGKSNDFITGGGIGTVNQSRFAYVSARGGGGGHGGGGGGGGGGHSFGGGGGGGASPRVGGAAVIPVFAGGAAGHGQRNNHHGAAGICSRCRKGMLLINVATTLTSLLLRISV